MKWGWKEWAKRYGTREKEQGMKRDPRKVAKVTTVFGFEPEECPGIRESKVRETEAHEHVELRF